MSKTKIPISDNYKCIAEQFGEKIREFDYAVCGLFKQLTS
jgi:hypothetical protein